MLHFLPASKFAVVKNDPHHCGVTCILGVALVGRDTVIGKKGVRMGGLSTLVCWALVLSIRVDSWCGLEPK